MVCKTNLPFFFMTVDDLRNWISTSKKSLRKNQLHLPSKLTKKKYAILADKFSNNPSTHWIHKFHSVQNFHDNKNIHLTIFFSNTVVPVDQLHGSFSYNTNTIYSTKTSSPTESYASCSSISLLSFKQQSDDLIPLKIIRYCSFSRYCIPKFLNVPRKLFFATISILVLVLPVVYLKLFGHRSLERKIRELWNHL